jgi:oxalate decarboxylase family bicupin protein
MLAQKLENLPGGGTVRITDSSNFPLSTTIAAAHVTISPAGLREMHWHLNADEWSFFIQGRARVTVFASSNSARTFNYVAGDVGIVPKSMSHFVEISEDEEVEMLEMFRAPRFEDFSLEQWLAGTPKRNVAEHILQEDKRAGEAFVQALDGAKKPVKPRL